MVVQPGLCGTWSETPKTGFLSERGSNKHLICSSGLLPKSGKKKTINSGRNIKKRRQKKNKASEDTEVAWKKSELIEAPVSHIIEMTEAPGSDIIEKGEEIKAVMEQSDPAVEITEIEEPVNKVLNPTTSS